MGPHIAGDRGKTTMAEGTLEKGNGFAHTDSRFRKAFQAEGAESRPGGWKTQVCGTRVGQDTSVRREG